MMASAFPTDDFDDEIIKFIDSEKKENTVLVTKSHISHLSKWLLEMKQEQNPIYELAPEILNKYLCEFFMTLKKKNGTDYEPGTISSFNASFERYLRDNLYPVSLMSDKAFFRLREVIKAKRSILKKNGLGRKAKASEVLDQSDDSKLIEAGQLGDHSPKVLQTTLFYLFGKGFGLRGRDEHRKMNFGDVIIEQTNEGQEYLLFLERNSKSMDGTRRDDYRPVRPKLFETGGGKFDPVRLFKLFSKKRPAAALNATSPMYLTPVPEERIKSDHCPWYYDVPMGKNMLGTLISTACKNAGVQGRKTNHSIRKRTVSDLASAGVPPEKIVLITGHKNTASLQHYSKTIGLKEHQKLSECLTLEVDKKSPKPIQKTSENCNAITTQAVSHSSPSVLSIQNQIQNQQEHNFITGSMAHLFSANTFNNCSFHFNFEKK